MISQSALINLHTFFTRSDNVMDSAELINSELKCLDRWLKSNKISIKKKEKEKMFIQMKNI